MRCIFVFTAALILSTPVLSEPISVLNNVLCNGIGVHVDGDLTALTCAGSLTVSNVRIVSPDRISLKADGAITLNDVSLDSPFVDILAGGSVNLNAGTTFISPNPLVAGRLVIRGVLSDSVVSLANAPPRNPAFSIQLISTQPELISGSNISISSSTVPTPNTAVLLLGALIALAAGKRRNHSVTQTN